MKKEFYDQFYHMLRQYSNSTAAKEDPDETQAMIGITHHLLYRKGDYTGLLQFLSYYGRRFIAPEANKLVLNGYSKMLWSLPKRIVDMGAGFGWLGSHLSYHLSPLNGQIPVLTIDKRQWYGTDIVADVESPNGFLRVKEALQDGDLLVMCEFLHCIKNRVEFLKTLDKYPVLIIEYLATDPDYQESYKTQIERYGAEKMGIEDYSFTTTRNLILAHDVNPYHMWLYAPGK